MSNELTEREQKVVEAMKQTSKNDCGEFLQEQNLSYMSFDKINKLFNNKRTTKGVLGSLFKKGFVSFDIVSDLKMVKKRNVYSQQWVETTIYCLVKY